MRNDIDSIRILATGYTGSGSDTETAQKIAGIVNSWTKKDTPVIAEIRKNNNCEPVETGSV